MILHEEDEHNRTEFHPAPWITTTLNRIGVGMLGLTLVAGGGAIAKRVFDVVMAGELRDYGVPCFAAGMLGIIATGVAVATYRASNSN